MDEWTNAMKIVGKRIIALLSVIFRADYSGKEVMIVYKLLGFWIQLNVNECLTSILLKYWKRQRRSTLMNIRLAIFEFL